MPTDWITHFGLREDPFADVGADGPFLLTPQLNQRLNLLLHLVQYSELMLVVTGSRGSGKTTLLQRLLADAGPRWRPCLIDGDPDLDPDALLARVVAGFDLPGRGAGGTEPMAMLESFLQGLRKGSTRAVLLVDDAHLLPPASVDQLARLAADRKRLGLAVVALGEPQLLERVARSVGSALLHVIDIPPLNEEQVAEYVELRLGWAGLRGRSPLGRDALHVLAKTSRGLPGLLNAAARQFLCNRAEGGQRGLRGLLRTVGKALTRHRLALAGTGLGVAIVGAGTVWLLSGSAEAPAPSIATGPIAGGPTRPGPDVAPPRPTPRPSPPPPRIEVVPPAAPPGAAAPPAPPTSAAAEPRPGPPPPSGGAAAPDAPGRASPRPSATPGPEVAGPSMPAAAPREAAAAPAASAPEPAREPVLGADESWILAQSANGYTVQVFGSHDLRAAERFKGSHRLKDRMAIYRTARDGKDWFVVVVGSYGTREAAQRAIQGLPAEVKRNNPWPRSIASVQESIRKAPPRN